MKVVKSSIDGKEAHSLVDEYNNPLGVDIVMDTIYETRDNTELDAKNILSTNQLEDLKEPISKPSRLEPSNLYRPNLLNTETGVTYVIKYGSIPELSERIDTNSAGVLLTIAPQESPEDTLSVFLPFKKDGSIASNAKYIPLPSSPRSSSDLSTTPSELPIGSTLNDLKEED